MSREASHERAGYSRNGTRLENGDLHSIHDKLWPRAALSSHGPPHPLPPAVSSRIERESRSKSGMKREMKLERNTVTARRGETSKSPHSTPRTPRTPRHDTIAHGGVETQRMHDKTPRGTVSYSISYPLQASDRERERERERERGRGRVAYDGERTSAPQRAHTHHPIATKLTPRSHSEKGGWMTEVCVFVKPVKCDSM
jgi:hypothetical protein